MRRPLVILLVVAALGAVWMYRSGQRKTDPGEQKSESTGLEQKILTFSIDGKTAGGVKQWHLEGRAAEIIDDEIHLEDLEAVAYGEGFTVNLTSDKGVYRRSKGEVELFGNVRVVSEDGSILTTDRAKWSYNTKEITTESMVDILRKDMYATGLGARANNEEKKAVLLRDVTVKMEPATLIKCDGPLEASFNDNVVVFSNNVRVTDAQGRLLADMMTVYIDPETKKIAKVVAEGNVKLLKGKSYTLCEKMVYTDGTGSVKFIGKPRVVIAPEELTESGLLTGGGGFLGGGTSGGKQGEIDAAT